MSSLNKKEEDKGSGLNRLLKKARLRRSPHPSSLRRTFKYASLLRISGALHPDIFDQSAKNDFFNRLSTLDMLRDKEVRFQWLVR
jgi:hypothetical protein